MKLPARFVAIASLLFAALPAGATIVYHVSIAHTEQHIFFVTMNIANARGAVLVEMPAWNALYQIRDFSYRVTNVRAHVHINEAGRQQSPLPVQKVDKETWRIGPPAAAESAYTVDVEYQIYWDEPGPFSTQLNARHAFVNLAEILFYVPERRAEEARVFFDDVPADWKIAAELTRGEQPNVLVAASYDALVDAPIEISKFREFQFDQGGVHYRVVVDGGDWDQGKLSKALERIVAYETKLMGGAPMPEYLFIFHFGPASEAGGGGMEHMNSTAIATGSGDSAPTVAAHEFFHLWNVKRIRPQTLEPVDYSREQYTRALWFAEGVTSTYGSYALERSGLWNRTQFYEDFASELADLDMRAARHWQSVEQSSLDAWLEKYAYYRWPEASVSYYNKGKIVGVLLDLDIRNASDNRKSLDDVVRALNEQFAKRGRFYNDSADIRAVAEQVCGCKLGDFFSRFVSGTEEIPYAEYLAFGGLKLKTETRTFADFGFWPGRGPGSSTVVSQVTAGSSAEAAGLHEGDTIVELNGAGFPRSALRWLREHKAGETIRLRVRRAEAEREISFALGSREERTYRIEEDAHAEKRQVRIREGLLQGTSD